MLKFRDKIIVNTQYGQVEGYVYFASPGTKEIYVILAGQNNKPVLVNVEQCQKILEPGEIKRKRGRPKKK